MLAFVLVKTFDLNIKQRLRVDLNTGTGFDKGRQTDFVLLFDLAILLAECRIVSVFLKINQLIKIVSPLFFSVLSSNAANKGLHCLIQRRGVMPLVTLWNLPGHNWWYSGNRSLTTSPNAAPLRRLPQSRRPRTNSPSAPVCGAPPPASPIPPCRRASLLDQHLKRVVDLLDDLHMTRQQRFYQWFHPSTPALPASTCGWCKQRSGW